MIRNYYKKITRYRKTLGNPPPENPSYTSPVTTETNTGGSTHSKKVQLEDKCRKHGAYSCRVVNKGDKLEDSRHKQLTEKNQLRPVTSSVYFNTQTKTRTPQRQQIANTSGERHCSIRRWLTPWERRQSSEGRKGARDMYILKI